MIFYLPSLQGLGLSPSPVFAGLGCETLLAVMHWAEGQKCSEVVIHVHYTMRSAAQEKRKLGGGAGIHTHMATSTNVSYGEISPSPCTFCVMRANKNRHPNELSAISRQLISSPRRSNSVSGFEFSPDERILYACVVTARCKDSQLSGLCSMECSGLP